jgi:hypothetical protein
MLEVVKEDKRKKKPTVLEGGNRVAVSEAEAAQIMGLKESDTFRKKFVPNFIKPSYYPGSKRPMYNIFEVLGLLDKTKITEGYQAQKSANDELIERVKRITMAGKFKVESRK